MITDSRQFIMKITSDVSSQTYHRDVLKLRSHDDLEQCSILAVCSIKENASIGSGDKVLDESIASHMISILSSVVSQEINVYLDNKEDPIECSDTVVQRNSEALEFNVHHITQAVSQALWHIRTGHQSNRRTQMLQKCLKGLPKLPAMQQIESCVSCTVGKLRKKARGTLLKHPVKYPFQVIELDPGFMFQNSKDKQRIKSLESYNGHNAYLLLYCVKTTVMCGPTKREATSNTLATLVLVKS